MHLHLNLHLHLLLFALICFSIYICICFSNHMPSESFAPKIICFQYNLLSIQFAFQIIYIRFQYHLHSHLHLHLTLYLLPNLHLHLISNTFALKRRLAAKPKRHLHLQHIVFTKKCSKDESNQQSKHRDQNHHFKRHCYHTFSPPPFLPIRHCLPFATF